jgi:hypothetical protein
LAESGGAFVNQTGVEGQVGGVQLMLVGAALGCFQSRLGYRLRRVPPDRSQGIRAGLFSCIEPPLFAPVADIGRKRK